MCVVVGMRVAYMYTPTEISPRALAESTVVCRQGDRSAFSESRLVRLRSATDSRGFLLLSMSTYDESSIYSSVTVSLLLVIALFA
jgi:hypothetical protein